MREVTSHIDIDAAPEQVWAVLEDLDGWSDWNPFAVEAAGEPREGERLRVRLVLPGRKASTFRPTVTEAKPGVVLEWLGRVGVPGIFDGRHRFELEEIEGGTRFHQSEQFTGILSRPIMRMIGDPTLQGFDAMNTAIKDRVESTPGVS